jgi:thiol-disulfide isomerase/thioredoxin
MRRLRIYLWAVAGTGLASVGLLGLSQLDLLLATGHFAVGFGLGLLAGTGGLVGYVIYVHRQASNSRPARPPPLPVEPTAAYDWRVTALDGTPFHMETLKGELLFLNIWSTLCAPCIAELPSIERLQKEIAGQGVTFMCVATDSDLERVREFVAGKGWTVPIFVHGEGDLPSVFDSDYIPATYVVSPYGLVVYQHTGAAQWDHPRVITFFRALALKHGLTNP